jgi:nucleoside-diphosphate-sugar epimerase
MKFAITGAAGHIGHRLATALVEQGHDVEALVHSQYRSQLVPDEATIHFGDIRDKSVVKKLLNDVDGVAHLAYGSGKTAESVNIAATKQILSIADDNNCDTFTFSSTIGAHTDYSPDDLNDYIRTKMEASSYIRNLDTDISTLTLYPSRVIGPGDYKTKRLAPYATVLSNRILMPPLYRFKERNYIHVDDIVDSMIAGLEGRCSGEFAATRATLTDKEYFSLIADASPRSHSFVPIVGGKWLVPKILNLGAKLGIVPQMDYTQVDWLRGTTSFPTQIEDQCPAGDRTVRQAVYDSMKWYQKSGLL